MTLSQAIAEFAVSTEGSSIPTSARAIARLSILDWIAVAVAGKDEPISRIVRDMVLEEGGSALCTVIGSDIKLPARAAALTNGATSHALDYDDTHFIYLGHPSVTVVPAALAVAEKINASVGELIDASLIGSEVACRIGAWLGRKHYQSGFHITATAGSFAAAMAACRLLKLSAEQARHALGIASTRSSGIKAQFGTMGKPFHAGIAAANGVEAATLAASGFVANPQSLEANQGFAATHAGESDTDSGLDKLAEHFVFESVQHKFHACCHGTHASIEAISRLRERHLLKPGGVTGVTVTVHPRYLKVCNIAAPATGLECKFSLRMTAAMAIAGRDTRQLETFSDTAATDGELISLRDRVEVETDSSLSETMARVVITKTDRSTLEGYHDLNTPLSYAQRETKIRGKAASLLGGTLAELAWQQLDDPSQSVGTFTAAIFNSLPTART